MIKHCRRRARGESGGIWNFLRAHLLCQDLSLLVPEVILLKITRLKYNASFAYSVEDQIPDAG